MKEYADFELPHKINNFYLSNRTDDFCRAHYQRDMEIIYNISGKKNIIINSVSYTLKENQLAIISPFAHHQYLKNDATSQQIIAIIPNNLLGDYNSYIENKNLNSPILTDVDNKILAYLKQLNLCNNGLFRSGIVNCVLGLIVSQIKEASFEKRNKPDDFFYKILDYINNNYTENLSLDSLSAHFGYSKYYFSKTFNDHLLVSLSDYIGSIRVEKTLAYIKEFGVSVEIAANSCGFRSVKTFYIQFKKKYPNSTPKQINRIKK